MPIFAQFTAPAHRNQTNQPATYTEKHLEIHHTFSAPRELVFSTWTEAERLKEWWGPKGFGLEVKKLEEKPGGTFHYCKHGEGGFTMWGKFVFREMQAPAACRWLIPFPMKTKA